MLVETRPEEGVFWGVRNVLAAVVVADWRGVVEIILDDFAAELAVLLRGVSDGDDDIILPLLIG